ncbi:MAG: hypothetical protein LBB34_04615 [Holosporales bacterium]|jgi:hypothetical protein|nr:hypothetical protein [Holosporales bacterium]
MYLNSISEIERLSILNELVIKYYGTCHITQSIRIARDLARIIDEFTIYAVTSDKLTEEFFAFFSEHWQQRTKFLKIVTKYWPMVLQELGKTDIQISKCNNGNFNSCISFSTLTCGDIENVVGIFEGENVYDEIEFIVRKIKERSGKKVFVVSPDRVFTKLISERLKIADIGFVSETNDEFEEFPQEFLEEIWRNFHDVSEEDKLTLAVELIDLAKIEKVDKVVSISELGRELQNADVVFCANLNEDSWKCKDYCSFLLHHSIRRKLKLPEEDGYVENHLCTYIKDANEVYLTRGKKTNGISMCEASVLAKFKAICQKSKFKTSCTVKLEKQFYVSPIPRRDVKIDVFPSILTSWDIELLMKDPEGFYAKEILHLQINDINKLEKNFSMTFKKIIYEYFTGGTSLQSLLSSIKELDFFRYQKCLNVVNWLRKRQEALNSKNDIYGGISIQGIGVALRGHCDRIVFNGDFASIVNYRTTVPQSTKEIVYGSESSVMATCLIAHKGGFQDVREPIEEIQIWSIASSGNDPIDIKSISISKDIIESFEERLVKALSSYQQNKVRFEDSRVVKDGRYKHFERI